MGRFLTTVYVYFIAIALCLAAIVVGLMFMAGWWRP